jgi:hypothetical protein
VALAILRRLARDFSAPRHSFYICDISLNSSDPGLSIDMWVIFAELIPLGGDASEFYLFLKFLRVILPSVSADRLCVWYGRIALIRGYLFMVG